ncbi:MAG TPA: hypothetical protein VMV94_17095 [Phycisphaerae bacterium]|nr:hypothetical protein [Phycisphaerae bacterium]
MNKRGREVCGHGMGAMPAAAMMALTFCVLGGCAQPRIFEHRPTSAPVVEQSKISKEELHAALDDFKDVFESTVKQAAGKIEAAATDANTRKNTLMWQVRMISACYMIFRQDEDLKVFLDLWTLCIRMNQYFQEGDGCELFGGQQDVAISAAQRLQSEIERIGRTFMSEEQFVKAKKDAEAFAYANPIRAGFNGAVVRTTTTTTAGEPNALTAIVTLPLAPFRAMGGVDRGAEAIRGFTQVADRFTDDFETLPENIRWQLLLLLAELEDNRLISSALSSFEQFSRSSARLSETADKLPEELRRQASGLIDEIDSKQGNIQSTLAQAEKTANAIERTGQSVADAGRAWEATARTIGETVDGFRGKGADAPAAGAEPAAMAQSIPPAVPVAQGEGNGASSDHLDDVRRTAETLTATATELRLFTAEARKLLDSPELAANIREVDSRMLGAVDHTSRQAQGLTDHIAWRCAQLIFLIFALGMVYRAAARRMAKKVA